VMTELVLNKPKKESLVPTSTVNPAVTSTLPFHAVFELSLRGWTVSMSLVAASTSANTVAWISFIAWTPRVMVGIRWASKVPVNFTVGSDEISRFVGWAMILIDESEV